ncbi:hypothetical protein E2C01_068355 [Portunus trituberculatus]|uniref:Uncharacterized protein n=1 Tax=Portunus trituberculatus TaxID=210409 RepID=A0A5B7HM66_PORTR|nr:hypothetical protein [Portunus trituberculatus]
MNPHQASGVKQMRNVRTSQTKIKKTKTNGVLRGGCQYR